MPVRDISPQEARELLDSDPDCVYLDVRSTPEFAEGHPVRAVNLPLLNPDPTTGQMTPNPDFLKVVQANYTPNQKLLVGCHSGRRSRMAAEMLDRAGYENLANVRAGFGGARDPSGRLVEPGWEALGLPVGRETEKGNSYQSLRRQVPSQ